MSFPLTDLPKDWHCPGCGHTILTDIPDHKRFEDLVARELKAQQSDYWNPGFDVSKSELYPGLTFQVKFSNVGTGVYYSQKKVWNLGDRGGKRNNTWYGFKRWAFGFNLEQNFDWCIIFGILNDKVYPFLIPASFIRQSLTPGKNGKSVFFMCTDKLKCGRGGPGKNWSINRGWQYYLPHWPEDLHRILSGNHAPIQPALFDFQGVTTHV